MTKFTCKRNVKFKVFSLKPDKIKFHVLILSLVMIPFSGILFIDRLNQVCWFIQLLPSRASDRNFAWGYRKNLICSRRLT